MNDQIKDLIKITALKLEDPCGCNIPNNYFGIKEEVESLIRYLRTALYPYIFGKRKDVDTPMVSLEKAYKSLSIILPISDESINIDELYTNLLNELDNIRILLDSDINAAYKGDPAAKSTCEIMLSYPAFEAISIYRLAHVMYLNKAYTLARMMSEYAHKISGIDIHPGASIGKSFFIDHGTGVVIGETCVIGNNVKIYQGVTLGAKSFPEEDDGSLIKGIKRHPNIEDNVIIYANATILGGDTIIGEGSVIGGNVWLTESVKKGSHILQNNRK